MSCGANFFTKIKFSDQRVLSFTKMLHVIKQNTKVQTSFIVYVTVYMNNVVSPFAVDGSPVSVRRYKAIFEQDQLSAERAREPGTHCILL